MKFDTMTSFKIDLQKMIHLTKLGYELGVAHFEGNFKENRYVERLKDKYDTSWENRWWCFELSSLKNAWRAM